MAARTVITGNCVSIQGLTIYRTKSNSHGISKRPIKKAPPTLEVKALCSTNPAINLDAGTQTEKTIAVIKKMTGVRTPAEVKRTKNRIAAKTQALAVNKP